MHVPDGFLDAPTSVATGVVAAAGVAVALRGARRELDDRTAPMAGLVATFVFAGQMMNFPVGAGTSGHLLGGALAAVLVGPVHRRALHQRGAARPGAVHGRRRHHRARHQHHADGARRRRASAGSSSGPCRRCCRSDCRWSPPAAAIAALRQRPGRRARRSPRSSRSAARPRSTRDACSPRWSAGTRVIGIGEAVITGLVVGSVVAARPDLVLRRPPGARASATARDPDARWRR